MLILTALLAFQSANASEVDELLSKAEMGDADSQYTLGMQYKNGQSGRDQNDDKAQKWLTSAAEYYAINESTLSPSNLHNLSSLFEQGLGGLEKDLSKAHKYLSSAAHGGNVGAQLGFAMKFEKGKYLEKDISKAKHWYTKAAKQGHFYATYKLGKLASSGLYVENDQRNLEFAKLAMSLILERPFRAIADLVKISKEGLKCESLESDSYVTSYMWFQVAKTNGLAFMTDRKLDKLTMVMSDEDITKSKVLAEQCVESNYQNCRYNLAPVKVVYDIKSDLIKSEDILKSSSCKKGGHIAFRYLYSDKGVVFQQYKGKSELDSEFVRIGVNNSFKAFDTGTLKVQELVLDGEKPHKRFNIDGTIASEYEYSLISEAVKSKFKLNSDAQFKKIVQVNYDENGKVESKKYYGPVMLKKRSKTKELDQYVDRQDYFDESGKLMRRVIYKKNRPHWQETYKEDGSLGKKYRVR
jgi:hypothetical protein